MGFRNLHEAELASTENPVSLEAMRGTDAISAARQARRALELPPSEPVPHLLSVMEWHGVIGLVLPNIKSRDAFSVWLNRSPVIAISAGRAGDCTRMSVSHELGHLLMHAGKSRFEVKEAEAEEFAAEFLMPQSAMRKEIRLPVTLSSLADLKPRWKVPLQVLIRRAKGLDIITERQSRYLTDKCSDLARGNLDPYRISEEKPRALRQLAEMLYGDPIDYQTMANDLAVNADHLIEMLEQCAAKHESRLPTRPISTMPRRHRT